MQERDGMVLPAKGLVVREPWVSKLLEGSKTWELRGSATSLRGRAALIASGTGTVVGEADLIDCRGPLSREELESSIDRHAVSADFIRNGLRYSSTYAWVFTNPVRYSRPVPYDHPRGAVIWVNLPVTDISPAPASTW